MTAWIGVASKEHVSAAVEGGFCQLNHGKEAPLKRMKPGDHIVYYAPRERMRAGEIVQAFVALGTILACEPYQMEGTGDFRPYRRKVEYHAGVEAPIRPLIEKLSFLPERASQEQVFRRGTFKIDREDLAVIAHAMKVSVT